MASWEMTKDEYVKADLANKRKHGVVGSMRFGGAKGLRSESEKWHKLFVKDALEKGKPVPSEVLKDYPDLITKKEGNMNKSKKIINLVEGISDDTVLMPDVIADTVIGNVIDYLAKSGKKKESETLSDKQDEYVQQLVDRAEKMYEIPKWKKIFQSKGDKGRDYLYSFMQHWLSSYLQKDMGIEMPQSFSVKGEPL